MYGNGQGVAQNDRVALKWFKLAAKQGDARAQCNLGTMYSRGQGVPQDDKAALKWFRLAAEQGVAEAQAAIDLMREAGRVADCAPSDSTQKH